MTDDTNSLQLDSPRWRAGLGALTFERTFADLADKARKNFDLVEGGIRTVARSPQAWLRLIRNLSRDPLGNALFSAACALARRSLPAGALERYALLHAAMAVAPRVQALPVHPWIKKRYAAVVAEIIDTPPHLCPLLDSERWTFSELAQIVSLRRFPAGQHNWVVGRAGRSAILRLRLRASEYPRLLRELLTRYGGMPPVASIHLSEWRARPDLVLKGEGLRSMYRIARTLELQPWLSGIQGMSWLHSKEVGSVSPHLAWLHELYVENGAFTAEMEPANPKLFMRGSTARRELFARGTFAPPITVFLWHRDDVLRWAQSHPEYGDEAPR